MGMAFFLRTAKSRYASLLIISAVVTVSLAACQPPDNSESALPSNEAVSAPVDSPIIISSETVTMAADYILNIKPSRYQPSLGLQGVTEPIKQAKFRVLQDVSVAQVLVTEGQWVKKGTPLLILQRIEPTPVAQPNDGKNSEQPNTSDQPNTNTQAAVTTADQSNTVDDPSDKAPVLNKTSQNANTNATDAIAIKAPNRPSLDETGTEDANDKINEADTKTDTRKDDNNNTDNSSKDSKNTPTFITVRASFSGHIDTLPQQGAVIVVDGAPLLTMSDDTNLRFIATLPMQAKPQLSVGQTVNFSTQSHEDTFSGQISKLAAGNQPDKLLVYVHVINNEASRGKLTTDMQVSGRVNYGQIEVGTIVPKRGIHDVDLTALESPPYQPLTPLKANVWIIQQDQRLTRQPVEVIEYNPTTGQYLIAGISNDSLICLADLPVESAGKKVVVS